MSLKNNNVILKWMTNFYKQLLISMALLLLLFVSIGVMTTTKSSAKLSNNFLVSWTSNLDQSMFFVLFGMENTSFSLINDVWEKIGNPSDYVMRVFTSIKFGDAKSFLSNEIPGFSTYENTIIIAGEGMDRSSNFSDESGPPLEEVLLDRVAIDTEEIELPPQKNIQKPDKFNVFLYTSHNRESFLPHLPDVKNPDQAYHKEINITKVSSRLADSLTEKGIGAVVDKSDIMQILNDKEWSYGKSYAASRPIVEEALANYQDIQYVIDVHRDSLPRDLTTKDINGTLYSRVLFVIGAEYKNYEKNLKLATKVHYMLEEKYPGLSKGVITKEGAGSNGIYNQDLLENSFLVEVGGYDNTLDEMYRTTDILAEVMSELFFEAEQVSN